MEQSLQCIFSGPKVFKLFIVAVHYTYVSAYVVTIPVYTKLSTADLLLLLTTPM